MGIIINGNLMTGIETVPLYKYNTAVWDDRL
jgi:hypothetical protein